MPACLRPCQRSHAFSVSPNLPRLVRTRRVTSPPSFNQRPTLRSEKKTHAIPTCLPVPPGHRSASHKPPIVRRCLHRPSSHPSSCRMFLAAIHGLKRTPHPRSSAPPHLRPDRMPMENPACECPILRRSIHCLVLRLKFRVFLKPAAPASVPRPAPPSSRGHRLRKNG